MGIVDLVSLSKFSPLKILKESSTLGRATFYHVIDKSTNKVMMWSTGLYSLISSSRFNIIESNIINYIPRVTLDAAVHYGLTGCIIVFVSAFGAKGVMKILTNITGGGWISYKKLINENDLEPVYKIYQDVFSDQTFRVPFNVAKALVAEKFMQAWVVINTRSEGKESRIAGFFIIQFLSEKGHENVISGRKDGTEFDSTDLVKDANEAAALYVGAIGAEGIMDRGRVHGKLIEYAYEAPNLPMYGRPTTKEGLKLAKKFEWSPLKDKDGKDMKIWRKGDRLGPY